MPFTTAFFQCANHGSVYKMQDASVHSMIRVEKLEPLIKGIPQPTKGDKFECPLCGGGYRILFTDKD